MKLAVCAGMVSYQNSWIGNSRSAYICREKDGDDCCLAVKNFIDSKLKEFRKNNDRTDDFSRRFLNEKQR
jgi:hypothetical protein